MLNLYSKSLDYLLSKYYHVVYFFNLIYAEQFDTLCLHFITVFLFFDKNTLSLYIKIKATRKKATN